MECWPPAPPSAVSSVEPVLVFMFSMPQTRRRARPRASICTFILQDPEAAWSAIFLLVAAVNVSSLLFYLVFAAADVQAWAQEKQLTRL